MFQRIVPTLALAALAAGAATLAQPAAADTLLMQRVETESKTDLPRRGMLMAQVENRYGAPRAKLNPAGGNKPQHPVINRWEYDNFIVYFERDHVIDAVLKQASPTEQGVKRSR
ncbi:hypothetical protein [Tahibacter soli]|jgi:hypothetical protein|uniref:Uncharacterized protein n=1 Tax=Tahibacter soli TaxID=2983605 RepID=A0A9X3YIN3_9GAMM|nr:hypothetical protein [Tahibacter soli]MDC8013071.1 hypothetical protein [Tahibacter soli]